jgi:hypothetical protein
MRRRDSGAGLRPVQGGGEPAPVIRLARPDAAAFEPTLNGLT